MKKINKEVLTKIIILALFCIYFAKIVITNELKYYVHPRLFPLIIISLPILILMIVFLMFHIYDDNKKIFKIRNYLIFIIPLITILIAQNNTNYNAPIKKASTDTKQIANNSKENKSDDLVSDTPKKDLSDNNNSSDYKDLISINYGNFVSYLNDISSNPSKYDGKEIEIDGFVYKDDKLPQNQFVVARNMMVCCAADMQIVGLRCDLNGNTPLSNNTWVKIHGKMKKDSYDGTEDVLIIIDSLAEDSSPNKSYVYPF